MRTSSALLGSLLLAGCSETPSGYHPVEQVRVITPSEPPSNSSPVEETTGSTPLVETVSVEQDLPVSALAPVNVIDGASLAMLLKVTENDAAANANSPSAPDAAVATTDKPRTVQLLIPEKTFQRDGASKALRVSYDDLDLLKVLNLDPVTDNAVELMPEWLKSLNGQRIRIRGFMYPTFESEGLERFVLARDNQICCFGRDPKLYDLVQVDMRSGKTTNYIPATRAFDVVGRFKIDLVSEDGKPYGLYCIEDAEVIDR
jgi:hypothetical protein